MTNNSIIILLFTLLLTVITLPANHAYTRTVSKEQLGIKDDQQTQLTFYYHDTTSVQIAKASGSTTNSRTTFGSLSMIDDPLTETSDSTSKLIGRAQGMYAMADQNEYANIMIMNILFLEGEHNGSTLSVLGRNVVNESGLQELPVIGGTGTYRFAKGYVEAKTQSVDKSTGNVVVEYNVFVSHSSTSITGSDGVSPSGDDGSSSSSGGGPSKNGSSSSTKLASHGSLSNLVSISFWLISLLYFCVV